MAERNSLLLSQLSLLEPLRRPYLFKTNNVY